MGNANNKIAGKNEDTIKAVLAGLRKDLAASDRKIDWILQHAELTDAQINSLKAMIDVNKKKLDVTYAMVDLLMVKCELKEALEPSTIAYFDNRSASEVMDSIDNGPIEVSEDDVTAEKEA